MINITLPDGSTRQYEKGTSAHQIALSISEGLARNVLAAEVNGEVWDSTRPIEADATVKLKGKDEIAELAQSLQTMQHNLRDPSRDRNHGRIYRVTYEGRPLSKQAAIHNEPIPKLLELLKSKEDRVRHRTRLELDTRKSADVVAELANPP